MWDSRVPSEREGDRGRKRQRVGEEEKEEERELRDTVILFEA